MISDPYPPRQWWKPKDHKGDLHLAVGLTEARRGDVQPAGGSKFTDDSNADDPVVLVDCLVVFMRSGGSTRYHWPAIEQRRLVRQMLGYGPGWMLENMGGVLGWNEEANGWEWAPPTVKQRDFLERWMTEHTELTDDGRRRVLPAAQTEPAPPPKPKRDPVQDYKDLPEDERPF